GTLRAVRTALDAAPAPAELRPFAERLDAGVRHVEAAFALFAAVREARPAERIAHILGALHEVAAADERLYPLRRALPPFADHWQLPGTAEPEAPATDVATGVMHVSAGGHHGGFSLFVPEQYAAERAWPVIVALHGGSGNGRDFLWTWLREAKSLGYLLVAPSAIGQTWGPVEDDGLLEILEWLGGRHRPGAPAPPPAGPPPPP